MKLKSISRYLITDVLYICCGGEFALYEGMDAAGQACKRFGDCEVVNITPGDNCLNVLIK
ncbi:MAG: hypothetical protein FWE08_06890 [Oscillospiraceae bacterium]|nr:hypothetical protein [Oscillospiraceae bacterium]